MPRLQKNAIIRYMEPMFIIGSAVFILLAVLLAVRVYSVQKRENASKETAARLLGMSRKEYEAFERGEKKMSSQEFDERMEAHKRAFLNRFYGDDLSHLDPDRHQRNSSGTRRTTRRNE